MSGAWVSLVQCNGNHGRRGVMLAAAAMGGCFTFGVGAGPIPFITVAVATCTALWIESVATRAASRPERVFMTHVAALERPPSEPPPAPCWEMVEVNGEKRLELHWKRE